MPKWIPGQGFFLVQPTGPIDEAENQKQMDLLERRLQAAELRFGIRKELSA
jgi:hypothetical protein